mgnify:CR=1 FL=1
MLMIRIMAYLAAMSAAAIFMAACWRGDDP